MTKPNRMGLGQPFEQAGRELPRSENLSLDEYAVIVARHIFKGNKIEVPYDNNTHSFDRSVSFDGTDGRKLNYGSQSRLSVTADVLAHLLQHLQTISHEVAEDIYKESHQKGWLDIVWMSKARMDQEKVNERQAIVSFGKRVKAEIRSRLGNGLPSQQCYAGSVPDRARIEAVKFVAMTQTLEGGIDALKAVVRNAAPFGQRGL